MLALAVLIGAGFGGAGLGAGAGFGAATGFFRVNGLESQCPLSAVGAGVASAAAANQIKAVMSLP